MYNMRCKKPFFIFQGLAMSLKYRISYKRKDPPLEIFNGQTSTECFPSDGINNAVFEDESAVTNQTRENGNDIRKPEAVNVSINDKGQNKEPEQNCESDIRYDAIQHVFILSYHIKEIASVV